MARTDEVRKECPSCGLGVPLDAKVCEFCGWDFEEEDEWILQIEKLEYELMLEKQKFEDTSVDKMIQSTLRQPERLIDIERKLAPAKRKKGTPKKAAPVEEGGEKPPGDRKAKRPKAAIPATPSAVASSKSEVDELDLLLEEEKIEIPPPPDDFEQQPEVAEKPVIDRPVNLNRPPATARPRTTGGKKVRRVVATKSGKPRLPAAPAVKAKQPGVPPSGKVKRKISRTVKGRPPSAKPPTPSGTKPKDKMTVQVFICPLCKKEVPENTKSCENCGAEFE